MIIILDIGRVMVVGMGEYKYADLLCPNKYNSKYTNEYYLKNILCIK